MVKKMFYLLLAMFLFGIAATANAALITIGTATYNGSDYNLIWDDDNNGNSVIWLDYTNNPATWAEQTAWAASLDGVLTYNFNPNYTVSWDGSWRLPATVDGQFDWGYDGTTTAGYNITSSEMGHLYYTELGNLGYYATNGTAPQSGWGLLNTGDFDNLHNLVSTWNVTSWYWSGTEFAFTPDRAWYFGMADGYQDINNENLGYCGLALRSGQVSVAAVPEPTTMLLLGMGLMAIAVVRRRQRRSRG